MSDWITRMPWEKIVDAAEELGIDPHLLGAVVRQESNGKTHAVRYEGHFKWLNSPGNFAKANGISEETETVLQKISFGLVQIMGGTARDIGFSGPLTSLCEPEIGLYWGGKYLKKMLDKYSTVEEALASYNAGSPRRNQNGDFVNQYYVDRVMRFYREARSF